MTVFLIGMPGSGKSTIGKLLAEHLTLSFFDTDSIISSMEGMSVSEIFESKGETYFRELEYDLFKTWKLHNAVIATGGGLPCHDNLIDRLNEIGTTIWLKIPIPILVERIMNVENVRPLLSNANNLMNQIRSTLKERTPFYSKANHKINANEDIEVVKKRILRKLYA